MNKEKNIRTTETLEMKKVSRVERHKIKRNSKFFSLIDDYCLKSKNMYNYGNYIIRQRFIETSKEKEQGLRENAEWIRWVELYHLVKDSEAFTEFKAGARGTIRKLDKAWKGFFKSIKDYSKHPEKYTGMPKMPKYLDKEKGRYEFDLENNRFKIKNGYIYIGVKNLKVMNNHFKTRIDAEKSKLQQIRFIPRDKEYIMEVVYEVEVPELKNITEPQRVASIDLGLNNLMTITTNCGIAPVVINGRSLKAINQYYNKMLAEKRSVLKKVYGKDWSNELQRITTKRNNKLDNGIHQATRKVIDFCIENKIDTLLCGYSTGWKKNVEKGNDTMQSFAYIAYGLILNRLEYKCEDAGINFKAIEEKYTSGTSYLDNEQPIEKNNNKYRRVYRGLFISNTGKKINADVNASYQLMRKELPEKLLPNVSEIALHPTIINLPIVY